MQADELSHPRELLRPCLLLLLAESRGHGYDLMARLKPFGFDWGGPGPIYRELRVLEAAGLVGSAWEAPGAGPARHVYELTPAGVETLALWAEQLEGLRDTLEDYRSRYLAASASDDAGTRPRVAVPSGRRASAAGEAAQGDGEEPASDDAAQSRPRAQSGRMRFRRR